MFDATVGGSESNSYVTVERAEEIIAATVNSDGWPTDTIEKQAALMESTRIIDSSFMFYGQPASDSQSLRWPRTGVQDLDGRTIPSNSIPKELEYAVVAFALYLAQNNGVSVAQSNVSRMKVGPIDMAFNSDVGVVGMPGFIVNVLSFLGMYSGVSIGSVVNVKAIRS